MNTYDGQRATTTRPRTTWRCPAGILQPPFFGAGSLGRREPRRHRHGDRPRADARLRRSGRAVRRAAATSKNWWQADDKTKFEAKGQCVAEQYDTFEALPKQFVNGQLTLGENIADLGGVKMAFKAYRSLRKDAHEGARRRRLHRGPAVLPRGRPGVVQQGCARPRRSAGSPSTPHAPPKFRVYGALRNLPEFSQAFQCAAGTPMHPAQTCTVW